MAPLNIGQVGGLLQKLQGAASQAERQFYLSSIRNIPPSIRAAARQFYNPDLIVSSSKPLMNPRLATFAESGLGAKNILSAFARNLAPGGVTGLRGSSVLAGASSFGGAGWSLADPTPMIEAADTLGEFLEQRGLVARPSGMLPRRQNELMRALGIKPSGIKPASLQTGQPAIGTQAVLNDRPVYWQGKDLGWQQATGGGTSDTLTALNAPGAQNRFIQDRAPGGAPQDRAYHEAAISAAQQTAQNPLFQKYQVADLTKQYNTASSPVEKQRIGLEIWAQTNPLLAAKLKSGQLGYAEAQAAPGLSNAGGSALGGLPMPTTQFDATSAVSSLIPMGQTFGAPIPGVGMVSATPQVFNPGPTQGALPNNLIQASYEQQLTSSPDFAKAVKDSAFLRAAYQQGLK